MTKASRIQSKAKGVGFDWDDEKDVWAKVKEELLEFESAKGDEVEKEFGDVLFSLINYARFKKIDPEHALELTNRKFVFRFNYLEAKAKDIGKELQDMTLAEMDVFWNEAKTLEE